MKILPLLLIINIWTGYTSSSHNCGIVTMDEWNGAPSLRTDNIHLPVHIAVVQHTVSQECNTDEECEDVVTAIREFHINTRNFTDIGNSFYIGGNGVVYEGSGWRLVGEHTTGYDNVSYGISFIGDFRDTLPTEDALQAALQLLACGVRSHQLAEHYQLVGHMQLMLTQSPGQALQDLIQTWRHWTPNVTLPTIP